MSAATVGREAEQILARIEAGEGRPVYLIVGDAVLAEPVGERLAQALARQVGVEVHSVRRPGDLHAVIQDLKTFSLFDAGKVVLVIESSVLADREAAADLVDEVAEAPAVDDPEADLTGNQRAAASRLFQVLRLFGVDPEAGSAPAALGRLPDWVLQGGSRRRGSKGRRRGKKQVAELKEALARLLEAGRAAELHGWAESDAEELAGLLEDGLPDGHALVLVESLAASDHPVVAALADAGCQLSVGAVEVDRRGDFGGLGPFAEELTRQTGRSITPDALNELARRTLRRSSERGARESISPQSTSRLAAEYRKLAALAKETIDLELVESVIEDRGEEDVWKLLDALGEGRADEALHRLRRMLLSSEEPIATRLSLFSLLADFCRQLVAVQSLVQSQQLRFGERNYNRFKNDLAPRLQAELSDGAASPVARLHPFRLFRVYQAASRLRGVDLSTLPARVLETEQRLKGESGDPDTALGQLVAALSVGTRRSAAPRR